MTTPASTQQRALQINQLFKIKTNIPFSVGISFDLRELYVSSEENKIICFLSTSPSLSLFLRLVLPIFCPLIFSCIYISHALSLLPPTLLLLPLHTPLLVMNSSVFVAEKKLTLFQSVSNVLYLFILHNLHFHVYFYLFLCLSLSLAHTHTQTRDLNIT